jgi:broad specificity phosphatase PhoE
MPIKITYFVHGTTIDNEKGLASGWQPGELSELGKEQAEELGKQISGQHFDVAFCSGLKRAVNSAELTFAGRCKIIQDQRLRECDYGDLTGHLEQEFKNDLEKFVDKPFPGGESLKDVEKRTADFLEFLKKNYQGQSLAVFAHHIPQLAFDVLLKNKTWQQAISEDWRKTKSWQPGWEYEVK